MTMNEESTAIAAYCMRIGSECLARHTEGFFEYLRQLGYSPRTASEKRDLLARLGGWLDGREPTDASFDQATLDLFHRSLNRAGRRRRGEVARPVGCFSNICKVLVAYRYHPPLTSEPNAIDKIVQDYGRFLSSERGLVSATSINYLRSCSQFADRPIRAWRREPR